MRALALASLVALSALPRDARAYCFTTTCGESPACDGEPAADGCARLKWKRRCTGFSVQADGGAGLDGDEVEALTELAFDAWRLADCGDGASPGFVAQNLGQSPCDEVQYNKDAGNANIVVVRGARWPHPDTGHNIALTTTTFDPDTGALLDADIELNADGYELTITDQTVDYDLLSVLTHEAGHFLGLGHSSIPEATMFETYSGGTIELRTLDPDDILAICTLYPPDDDLDDACNPLPKHGFSPFCRDEQPEGSCALGRGGSGWAPLLGLFVAASALRVRTARRRRSRTRSA